MSRLIRCITTDGLIIGAAIDSTDIVKYAESIHCLSPVATAALGRLLTGASIMGNRLKEEGASLTVRADGDGVLGVLMAVSDNMGNVRGFVENPQAMTGNKIDLPQAVGSNGLLSVIKDYGEGQPYTAQIPLVSGNIAEDLTDYYAKSEQLATVMILGVHFSDEGEVVRAGGLLLQLLPAADEREIVALERNLEKMESVTTQLAKGATLEEICQQALDGFELEFFDQTDVEYRCYCSRERVERMLLTLSADELRSLPDESGKTEVCCHFCEKRYVFTLEQLEALAAEKE